MDTLFFNFSISFNLISLLFKDSNIRMAFFILCFLFILVIFNLLNVNFVDVFIRSGEFLFLLINHL